MVSVGRCRQCSGALSVPAPAERPPAACVTSRPRDRREGHRPGAHGTRTRARRLQGGHRARPACGEWSAMQQGFSVVSGAQHNRASLW